MASGLRRYLDWLEKKGLLVRVEEELSPVLEIPCFLRRVMYRGGPAVLFERVKGYPGWRVAGNLFVNPRVVAEYLSLDSLEKAFNGIIEVLSQASSRGLLGFRGISDLMKLIKLKPSVVGYAEFNENVVEASEKPLDRIPAFKNWPLDGGRYLTYPMIVTRDPEAGFHSISVYRVMIAGGDKCIIHWQIHKRGAEAYRRHMAGGGRMPVAIVVGSDLNVMLTAATPVPPPVDKYLYASIIGGSGVKLYKLPNNLLVPADAEVVIEGYVEPGETAREGPFGDHWGYYDEPLEEYPVMRVERVYFRSNPIYYGSVTGKPPLEDSVIGCIVERMFKPLLKTLLPEVVDIHFPPHACYQGILIVSIRKSYPGQAKKVMMALWGLTQTSLTKIIVVVDHDINPRDINQVLWAIASNVNPERDVVVIPNTHTDALDPASKAPAYGGKLGIDATRKLREENYGREWPRLVEEDETVYEKIARIADRMLDNWFRRNSFCSE